MWQHHGVPGALFIRRDIQDHTEEGEGKQEPLCQKGKAEGVGGGRSLSAPSLPRTLPVSPPHSLHKAAQSFAQPLTDTSPSTSAHEAAARIETWPGSKNHLLGM